MPRYVHPSMTAEQVHSHILSIFEDFLDIDRDDANFNGVYNNIADSLTETWFKDRARAIAAQNQKGYR